MAQKLYESNVPGLPRYDAILVDEGQDFTQEWWNFLRRHVVRNDSSEMVLAADVSQDIYENRSWVDEESMRGCGFSGAWTNLAGSYRIPVDMAPILGDFIRSHLPSADPPTSPNDHSGIAAASTIRRWVNSVSSDDREIAHVVLKELGALMSHDSPPHAADTAILVSTHQTGLEIVSRFPEGEIEHIFAKTTRLQSQRKNRFWPGVALLKGSTVHSFKGWEVRALVIVADEEANETTESAIRRLYVALTRVKGDPLNRSAFVTVINRIPALASFKSTFEREVGVDEVPALGGQVQMPFN
jgi:superfamily I DNA/RNA helicase